MNKILFFFLIMMPGFTAISQKSQQQVVEDSVYGWYKIYHFKAKEYKPQVAFGRTYTPKQKAYVDSIANWIQASYIPKGGIGDVKRRLISPSSVYLSLESLPQAYGATAFTWSMFVTPQGKHEIIRETEIPFGIYANETIGMPIHFLCTPQQYYFTRPGSAEERFSFSDPSLRKKYDITQLPQLKKFITFYSQASNYDRNAGLVDAVLLSKDNRMPFIKVTKREYLGLLPDAIERKYQEDKKYAENGWPEGKARTSALTEAAARKEKRMLLVKENLDRYRNRLDEPAEVVSIQPSVLLENSPDIFEGSGAAAFHYPVYKVDPEMKAKCKEDNPQWILITWNWEANDPKLVHMHESIINNFNFDYVYDFFFNPDKVKGKPYKPLHDPYPVAVNNKGLIPSNTKKVFTEKGVLFYEDFTSSGLNQKPVNWYSEISIAGVHALVTQVNGVKGNWLQIKGNKVSPLQLPVPLPADFTISFDVAVPKGFTWGAKGLEMIISQKNKDEREETSIRFRMRPGFDGRDGFTSLMTSSSFGKTENTTDGEAKGFSNNNSFNLVKVVFQKAGEQISVKVNGNPAGTLMKKFPPETPFNYLAFSHSRSDAESEKYYISNISIENK